MRTYALPNCREPSANAPLENVQKKFCDPSVRLGGESSFGGARLFRSELGPRKLRGDALPQALGSAAGRRRIVVDVGVILRDRTRVSDSDRPRFAAGCYLPRHQAEPGRPGSSTEVPRCGNLNTAAPLSGVACGSPRRRRRLTRPLIVPTSSTRMAGVDSVFVCEA
jgi:hypothetical protein